MNVSLSLISILLLIGMSQGLFLVAVLFSLRFGNRKANRYLGYLTLVFVLVLLDYFLEQVQLPIRYTWLRTLIWPRGFLLGAFIYLYVRQLTRPDIELTWRRDIWHFVPAVVHVIVTWPLLFLGNEAQFTILFNDTDASVPMIVVLLYGDIESLLTFLQITCYLILSLKLVRNHRRRIVHSFSNLERINLNWLYRLLFALVAVYLIWFGELFFIDIIFSERVVSALVSSSIVVLIFLMAFLGLQQPLIYSENTDSSLIAVSTTNAEDEPPPLSVLEDCNKYRNSALSESQSASLYAVLQGHMRDEKAFLNHELSLTMLSEQIGVSNNYLSQVINQQAGKSFFDYVNEFRIEEAKSRLAKESQLKQTVLDLAMSVGFNSKSAFYSAFKKHTAMTPSEYRKSLNRGTE